jgi:hypothetical protein
VNLVFNAATLPTQPLNGGGDDFQPLSDDPGFANVLSVCPERKSGSICVVLQGRFDHGELSTAGEKKGRRKW